MQLRLSGDVRSFVRARLPSTWTVLVPLFIALVWAPWSPARFHTGPAALPGQVARPPGSVVEAMRLVASWASWVPHPLSDGTARGAALTSGFKKRGVTRACVAKNTQTFGLGLGSRLLDFGGRVAPQEAGNGSHRHWAVVLGACYKPGTDSFASNFSQVEVEPQQI